MKQEVWWVLRRPYGKVYCTADYKETGLLSEAFRCPSFDSVVKGIQERARSGVNMDNWYPRPVVEVSEPVFREISLETILDWEPSE